MEPSELDTSKLENWSERKQALLQQVFTAYNTDKRNESTNWLLAGFSKSGKTFTLKTARKPVAHISFDPNNLDCVKGWMKENPGAVLPFTDCEIEDPSDPIAYIRYREIIGKLIEAQMFENIGTCFVDGLTFLGDAILRRTLKLQKRVRGMNMKQKENAPRKQDYGILLTVLRDEMIQLLTLPCDVVLTAHLNFWTDENILQTRYYPMISGQSREQVPAVFSENYIMMAKRSSQGINRHFLTQPDGLYQAGSRLSEDGKLEIEEKPDFKYILEKVGRRCEDLPLFDMREITG